MRSEAASAQEARASVVKVAEKIALRRGAIERRAADDSERCAPVSERPQLRVELTATAAEPGRTDSASNGPAAPVRDAAAAVAALVEKIEAFLKGGLPALQVSFSDGVRALARVEVRRTARGEVALQLTAAPGIHRAQVSAHATRVRDRLVESGLRVASVVVA